jgi:hypothetical protein
MLMIVMALSGCGSVTKKDRFAVEVGTDKMCSSLKVLRDVIPSEEYEKLPTVVFGKIEVQDAVIIKGCNLD